MQVTRRGIRAATAAALGLFASLVSLAPAQASERENLVRSALLYSLTKFVEWPALDAPAITVCALGDPQFGTTLRETLSSRKIKTLPVQVRELAAAEDLAGCQILFIGAQSPSPTTQVLQKLDQRPVLTISDREGFVDAGGMVGFIRRGEKLKFELNVAAANRQGLRMSARLLRVAVRVLGRRSQGAESWR